VTADRLRRFDMNGNVWEWYWEGNEKYDAKSPAVDRSGAAGAFDRVVWRGCWDLRAVSTGRRSGTGARRSAGPTACSVLRNPRPV
jgi:formylglycine-generating enzyme required for sulfatase activity